VADKLSVAKESGCAMVVGVEECERLLLQDQEDGINKFEIFREIIHLAKVSCAR